MAQCENECTVFEAGTIEVRNELIFVIKIMGETKANVLMAQLMKQFSIPNVFPIYLDAVNEAGEKCYIGSCIRGKL